MAFSSVATRLSEDRSGFLMQRDIRGVDSPGLLVGVVVFLAPRDELDTDVAVLSLPDGGLHKLLEVRVVGVVQDLFS